MNWILIILHTILALIYFLTISAMDPKSKVTITEPVSEKEYSFSTSNLVWILALISTATTLFLLKNA